jgi:hypothetical protein
MNLSKILSDSGVKEKVSRAFNNVAGFGTTAVDRALFGMPSYAEKRLGGAGKGKKSISDVKKEFKEAHPSSHSLAKWGGDVGSFFLPLGIASRGLVGGAKLAAKFGGKRAVKEGGKAIVKLMKSKEGDIGKQVLENVLMGGSHAAAKTATQNLRAGDNEDKRTTFGKELGEDAKGLVVGNVVARSGKAILSPIVRGLKRRLGGFTGKKEEVLDYAKRAWDRLSPRNQERVGQMVKKTGSGGSNGLSFNNIAESGSVNTNKIMDDIYLNSPKARNLMLTRRYLVDEGSNAEAKRAIDLAFKPKGNSPKLKPHGEGREGADSFLKRVRETGSKAADKLYKQAHAETPTVKLDERLVNDPRFAATREKVLADRNKLDINKAHHGKEGIETLHRTKQRLGQEIAENDKFGKNYDKMRWTEPEVRLRETLEKASPTYAKAQATASRYLKPEAAVHKYGRDMSQVDKVGFDKFERDWRTMSMKERAAVTQKLFDRWEGKIDAADATKTRVNPIGVLKTPSAEKKIRLMLGSKRKGILDKELRGLSGAKNTYDYVLSGSRTAEHLANQEKKIGGRDVARMFGRSRLKWYDLIRKAANQIAGNDKSATSASQFKSLMSPKRLVRAKDRVIPNYNKNYSIRTGAVLRANEGATERKFKRQARDEWQDFLNDRETLRKERENKAGQRVSNKDTRDWIKSA